MQPSWQWSKWVRPWKLFVLLLLFMSFMPGIVSGSSRQPDTAGGSFLQQKSDDYDRLLVTAQTTGESVRVIVEVNVPYQLEPTLYDVESQSPTDVPAVVSQRRAIQNAQAEIIVNLQGQNFNITRQFDEIPFMGMYVDAAALQILRTLPQVAAIYESHQYRPIMDTSLPIIQAPTAWSNNLDGNGVYIAVIDTGVLASHEFFGGRVIQEACFSYEWVDGGDYELRAACPGDEPNGAVSLYGSGSANPNECLSYPNPLSEDCSHGTHVAGIMAGMRNPAHKPGEIPPSTVFAGVAPGARIFAVNASTIIQDFSGGPNYCYGYGSCSIFWEEDLISALTHVVNLKNSYPNLAAVNLSLGMDDAHGDQASCDAATGSAMVAMLNYVRSTNIATVFAAGNSGSTVGPNSPGCAAAAVSVAASTDANIRASYSQIGNLVEFYAPGGDSTYVPYDAGGIVSSVAHNTGAGTGISYQSYDGTSMATPHVTGAFALIRQHDPRATVDDVLTRLTNTGIPIASDGYTKPLINVNSAIYYYGTDSGDAPPSYGSATHIRSLNWRIGADSTTDDGVTLPAFFTIWGNTNITVNVPNAGYLSVWFDLNHDGDFSDPGERSTSVGSIQAGERTISIYIPSTATPGTTWARFRFSGYEIYNPTGQTINGEVEDYQVELMSVPTIIDQPDSQTITSGSTTFLSVAATGSPSFNYQWYQGASGNTSTPVGADSSSFTTPALTNTTSYWVRVTNAVGSTNSNTATITVQIPQECDVDTIGIYRSSDFSWYLRYSNTPGFAETIFNYGLPLDPVVIGDWDGDGYDTVAIRRLDTFYLKNDNTGGDADVTFAFGLWSDIPVAGDWDGDGVDTIGVYRPDTATWYLRNSNSSGEPDLIFTYGLPRETPVAGDWNGDGIDTVGIYRDTDFSWYLRNSNTAGFAEIIINFGLPSDDAVVGDWNGDCYDTVGIYRKNEGNWYLKNTNTTGIADLTFAYGLPGERGVTGHWLPPGSGAPEVVEAGEPVEEVAPEPIVERQLVAVEAGDAAVAALGAWTAYPSDAASGGSYLYSSGAASDALVLTFDGSYAELTVVNHPSLGNLVVEVDGVVVTTASLSGEAALGVPVVVGEMAAGLHTLRVYPETEGMVVAVDTFLADGTVIAPVVAEIPVPTETATPDPVETEIPTEVPTETVTEEPTPTETPLPVLLPVVENFDDVSAWEFTGNWQPQIDCGYAGACVFATTSLRDTVSTLTYRYPVDLTTMPLGWKVQWTLSQNAMLSVADSVAYEVSTDGGATWQLVAFISDVNVTWEALELDLSAYSGQVVNLRISVNTLVALPENTVTAGYWLDEMQITAFEPLPEPTEETPLPTEETPVPTEIIPTEVPAELVPPAEEVPPVETPTEAAPPTEEAATEPNN